MSSVTFVILVQRMQTDATVSSVQWCHLVVRTGTTFANKPTLLALEAAELLL